MNDRYDLDLRECNIIWGNSELEENRIKTLLACHLQYNGLAVDSNSDLFNKVVYHVNDTLKFVSLAITDLEILSYAHSFYLIDEMNKNTRPNFYVIYPRVKHVRQDELTHGITQIKDLIKLGE